jgi:sulfofructose kinase
MRFDVLGIGCTAVDEIIYVPFFPAPDGKVRVTRRERSFGGLTATALVAASRLGARAAFAGRLGPDELSAAVRADLSACGVDVSEAVQLDEARPGYATIVVDETAGTRAVLSQVLGVRGADDVRPPDDVIRASSVLFVDGHGLSGSIRAARIARASGRAVVADFEREHEGDFSVLLALVDHLVVSSSFAGRLSGAPDPAEAARRLAEGRALCVVTCGGDGGWFCEPRGVAVRYRAFDVTVKDTTGCGDVFHGAYAAGLAFGWDAPMRIRWASAAAALKAATAGGRPAIPDRARVEALLASG